MEQLTSLLDVNLHELAPHLLVQGMSGGKMWKKCDGTKAECSKKFNMMLDDDPDASFMFALKYWFFGLPYMIFGAFVLPLSLPFYAFMFETDPATMPGPIPDNGSRFGEGIDKWWNWFSLYQARLFMPYFYFVQDFMDGGSSVNAWNLRGMEADEGVAYFLGAWLSYPFIWVQAVFAFVLTLPVYPMLLVEWIIKKCTSGGIQTMFDDKDDGDM